MCSNQQQSTGTDSSSSATVASSTSTASAGAVTSTAVTAATATDANTLISLADYQHRLHQLYAQQAFRAATVAAAASNALSPASSSGHHFFSTASGHSFDSAAAAAATFAHHLSPFTARYVHDSRYRIEEPKPSCSYIGLIAMAIISSPERKMVLSDIYQHILDHYPYFRNRGPGWRNSIRHNLSLNDCFIKSGRSANGKGHYWAIHPANIDDFMKGDFRRRKAQRKVRKHLGLSVPDDEDSDSPAPTPPTLTPNGNSLNHLHATAHHATTSSSTGSGVSSASSGVTSNTSLRHVMQLSPHSITTNNCLNVLAGFTYPSSSRTPPSGMFKPDSLFESLSNHLSMLPPTHRTSKRLFDVESLLAPDLSNHHHHHHHGHHNSPDSGGLNVTSANQMNHRTSEQSNNHLNHNHNNNSSNINNINNNSSSNKLNDSSAQSVSPTQSLDEQIHHHHHHHHHHANHMLHSSKVLTGDSTSPTHSLADYRQSDSASSSCSSPSVTLSSASPPPAASSSSLATLASINCHALPTNGHHTFNSSTMSNSNSTLLDATNLANVWLQSPAIQSLTNLQQVNAAAAAAAMAGLINSANSVNSLSNSPNLTNGSNMSAAAAAAAAWTSATAAVASLSQQQHHHHHLQHSNSLGTPLSSYSPSPPHVSSHNGKSSASSPK